MGLGSQKPSVNTKYFLRTNSMFPFCRAENGEGRAIRTANPGYCSNAEKWSDNTIIGTVFSFISKFIF